MTVPASVEALTGKPDPGAAQAFARGILSEPYPLAAVGGYDVPATQVLSAVLVPVAFGTTVSGVAYCVSVAAAGTLPTGVYVGLYDLVGNRLAVSGNVRALANWNTVGIFSSPFTTPWVVTQDGAVYAAILKDGVFGTTEPSIAGMDPRLGSGAKLGANAAGAVSMAAQATMPATATLAATDAYPWLALV